MNNQTRIVELFISEDYDEAGIDAISLVSKPAHEETWLAFNKEQKPDFSPYKIVEDDFCNHNPRLDELGEEYKSLIKDGWEVVKVEKITPQMVVKMNQQKFSEPNENSDLDTDETRIRFKYVGPRDNKNRQFCSDMLKKNRVYRLEDIDKLTTDNANSDFGNYDIFLWRGSFNCRHVWVRLTYKREGKIVNNANSTRGLEGEESQGGTIQPDTRTDTTINSPTPENQWRPGTPRNGNLFSEATQDEFAESISDYPQGVKDVAKKVLQYTEKNGWGSCGTQVGKTRANQLAKGEPISVDTIKRMYSYLSRHKVDLQSSKSYDDGCGKLMYDSWGGEPALTWSERKLKQLENEKKEFAFDDEKRVMFVFDDEKRIVVGAAMVPNKMIERYDKQGKLYYVFFSKKSIKQMADKFLKEKRTDETSVEHDGIKLGSNKVFITESWVSEDPLYDKSKFYGFDLPAGTWFVAMKVNDNEVWKMIKKKSLTGFSVEGLFAEKNLFSKEDKQINQIKKLITQIKNYE